MEAARHPSFWSSCRARTSGSLASLPSTGAAIAIFVWLFLVIVHLSSNMFLLSDTLQHIRRSALHVLKRAVSSLHQL